MYVLALSGDGPSRDDQTWGGHHAVVRIAGLVACLLHVTEKVVTRKRCLGSSEVRIAVVGPGRVDAVFVRDHFPEFRADLVPWANLVVGCRL